MEVLDVMKLFLLTDDEWLKIADDAYKAVFGSLAPENMSKIERNDGAIAVYDEGELVGFCSFKEIDANSIFLTFGGAIPACQGKLVVARMFKKIVEMFEGIGFKRLKIRTTNDNIKMLRLGLGFGFKIIGTEIHRDKLFITMQRGEV